MVKLYKDLGKTAKSTSNPFVVLSSQRDAQLPSLPQIAIAGRWNTDGGNPPTRF